MSNTVACSRGCYTVSDRAAAAPRLPPPRAAPGRPASRAHPGARRPHGRPRRLGMASLSIARAPARLLQQTAPQWTPQFGCSEERGRTNAASSMEREVAHRLQRRGSGVVVFMVCFNYSICDITAPRYIRYTRLHGHDFLRLRTPSKRMAHIPPETRAVWDKVYAMQLLFEGGYSTLVYVDGDSAVLQWEMSVDDLVERRGGSNISLILSRDRGHFGWYRPPYGPNNFGVFILNDGVAVRKLLRLLIEKYSMMPRYMKWPAEQSALNILLDKTMGAADMSKWLDQGSPCEVKSRALANCPSGFQLHRATYCQIQCSLDFFSKTRLATYNRTELAEAEAEGIEAQMAAPDALFRRIIRTQAQSQRAKGVWVLHEVSAKNWNSNIEANRLGSWLPNATGYYPELFREIDRLFPIPKRQGT